MHIDKDDTPEQGKDVKMMDVFKEYIVYKVIRAPQRREIY